MISARRRLSPSEREAATRVSGATTSAPHGALAVGWKMYHHMCSR